jgi:flagellin-like protein
MEIERGVSPVVSVVMLIALVVVLGGVVAAMTLGVGDTLRGPAPQAAETTAEIVDLTGAPAACGGDTVKLTHDGGDTIDLEETTLLVRFPDMSVAEAKLHTLPTSGTSFDADNFAYDPDNAINDNCVRGALANNDGTWSAGSVIQFDLNSGGGTLSAGDDVEVVIVHEPSNSIITEERMTVQS